MIEPRRPFPARLIALGLLILVTSAGTGHAAALYQVTDLGSGRSYSFDAAGNLAGPNDSGFIRGQAGAYTISTGFGSNMSLQAQISFDGQTPIQLTSHGNNPSWASDRETILAYAVNQSGSVVGTVPSEGFGLGKAFVYTEQGGIQAVPLPYAYDGQKSTAHSLNDAGLIVGTVTSYNSIHYSTRAFLSDGQSSWDLNTLIGPDSKVLLTDAFDISDAGRIITRGTDAQGQDHIYLLTPTPTPTATPEPSSIAVVASGGLLYLARRKARRSRE